MQPQKCSEDQNVKIQENLFFGKIQFSILLRTKSCHILVLHSTFFPFALLSDLQHLRGTSRCLSEF